MRTLTSGTHMHGPKSVTKSLLSHKVHQIRRSNTYTVPRIPKWFCCRRDRGLITEGRGISRRQMVQVSSNCDFICYTFLCESDSVSIFWAETLIVSLKATSSSLRELILNVSTSCFYKQFVIAHLCNKECDILNEELVAM